MKVEGPTPSARLARPLVLCIAALLPGLLATLHSLAIMPLASQTVVLEQIQPIEGNAFSAPLPTSSFPAPNVAADVLHEDGRPMPLPGMTGWAVVAREGEGRYYAADDRIYFSATDNTDPRSNGRVYTVARPYPLPRPLAIGLWLIGLTMSAVLGLSNRRRVWTAVTQPSFGAAALLLALLFVANRLWLFTDYPLVAIHPDSSSYFAVAEQIGSGTWPNLGNRPPVYPLFLRAMYAVHDRNMTVAAAQTLLSLLGGVLLLYGVHRWWKALTLPAAGVLALFFFGFTTIEHDSAVLSESLYTSLVMCAFAGLIVGIRGRTVGWLLLSSVSMALAILTRPAGMFLVVIYVLVAAWIAWRRFSPRAVVAFLLPFPLILLAMCVYNWRVAQVFAVSTWGEANLAVATFTYWQTDPSYPPEVNARIERIQSFVAERFTEAGTDPAVLERSWDPGELSRIFIEGFHGTPLAIAMGDRYETQGRQWIRRVAFDSIRKRPMVYVKFVYAMLVNYYRPTPDFDFRLYIQNRAYVFYVDKAYGPEQGNPLLARLGKEYGTGQPPPDITITDFNPATQVDLSDRVLVRPTRLWRVYEQTHLLRRAVFYNWGWSVGVAVALFASSGVLLWTRFRHDGAFIVFVISAASVGAGLVVSMVEYSQARYSYPMEWVYGLSVILLPLLFVRPQSATQD